MANPTTGWDPVPVWGIYQQVTGAPAAGTVTFAIDQRITRDDGRIIYPEGAKATVTIGNTSQQDATVRESVRVAWRAADSVLPGFNGTAWDNWWTTVVLPSAIFTAFPASDDPDIVQSGFQVLVTETLNSGKGKTYGIQTLQSQLDLPIPGVNLGLIEVPPGAPTVPAPMYAKGVPGGVASLDSAGKVPASQLSGGGGGPVSWADLADKPAVIGAGATASAARSAIGATDLTLGSTGATAAAGNHNHAAASVMFTPAGAVTATNAQAAIEQAAALGGAGATDELVVYYSGGAYPTQPGSAPPGVKRRQFYGPVAYAGATWPGVIDLYTYAALA